MSTLASVVVNIADFICPISLEIMRNPVSDRDGINYEEEEILAWLRTSNTSPSTRRPLFAADLRPNRVLKEQIERYLSQTSAAPVPAVSPFADAPLTVSGVLEGDVLNVQVTPPENGSRQGVVMGIGVDCSGSMGLLACDTNETGGLAFTRLDLAKHTVRALATMLNENDKLFLVKYSDSAQLVLPPTAMTDAGKEQAFEIIKALVPGGSTNIWHCLQTMNQVSSKAEFASSNVVTALLTDGLPNIRPPSQNEASSFEALARAGNLSTFGFGYDLDSKLLSAIAAVGGGSFGFIPDYSMVGTVFINWAATALATAAKDKTVVVDYADGSRSLHSTGLIQYGQPRNVTIRNHLFPGVKKPVRVSLQDSRDASVAVTAGALSDYVKARDDVSQAIRQCIGHDGVGSFYDGIYAQWASSDDSRARELVRDVKPVGEDDEGQIAMAPRYWAKWGKHYSRAYKRAIDLEQCMNFKDPGLAVLGGALFHEHQTLGDTVFCNLPPLEPTGQVPPSSPSAVASAAQAAYANRSAPINMGSVFMNQSNGCWAPGSLVRMEDGSRRPIEALRRGDRVWTASGAAATVVYSLALGTKNRSQGMCKYEGLWITPWHPVVRDGAWVFPSSFTTIQDRIMPVVHNLVLDGGHVVDVDGVLTVTLGHGITGDIIGHGFFGSMDAVLGTLALVPGFETGHVVFDDLRAKKDPVTNMITGWYNGTPPVESARAAGDAGLCAADSPRVAVAC